MTTPSTPSAPRTGLRRFAPTALVIVGVVTLVVVLAACLLFPSLLIPSSRLAEWQLSLGYGGPKFDPATAQTTTVIPLEVLRPTCAPGDDSWLGAPAITYTPWTVIITIHTNDAFGDITKCWTRDGTGQLIVSNYDTGSYLPVHLSEPLGGRALFDGSKFPPAARPYP
jgi:hypothetical protein